MTTDFKLHQCVCFVNSSELKELREDHDQLKIKLAKHEDIINKLLQRINDPDDSRSVGSISSNQHSNPSTSGEVVYNTGVNNDGCSATIESPTLQDQIIPHSNTNNSSKGKCLLS